MHHAQSHFHSSWYPRSLYLNQTYLSSGVAMEIIRHPHSACMSRPAGWCAGLHEWQTLASGLGRDCRAVRKKVGRVDICNWVLYETKLTVPDIDDCIESRHRLQLLKHDDMHGVWWDIPLEVDGHFGEIAGRRWIPPCCRTQSALFWWVSRSQRTAQRVLRESFIALAVRNDRYFYYYVAP